MTAEKSPTSVSQQDLLRDAMEEIGMTRVAFAARISVPVRTLDKWLLHSDSADFRSMPEMGKSYVREIVEWHRKTL